MGVNRGKQFESIIKETFLAVPNISVDRVPDQMSGYAGSFNICDFTIYKYPTLLYLECKTTYGNTFPLSRLTDNQFKGMLQKSKIIGVQAGIILWYVDKDVTYYVPIDVVDNYKRLGIKSIRWDDPNPQIIYIPGLKKRIFFKYDIKNLLKELSMDVLGDYSFH